jgi:hypothetical protein
MTVAYDVDTGVPPRAVQAWFIDLQTDDHTRGDHPRILRSRPGDYRKIISKSPARVEAEDGYRGGTNVVRFVLTKSGESAIDYDVEGKWYTSKGRLEATSIGGGGSHVSFRSDWNWKPGTWLTKLLIAGFLQKAIRDDFAAHVRDMEDDWKKQPW